MSPPAPAGLMVAGGVALSLLAAPTGLLAAEGEGEGDAARALPGAATQTVPLAPPLRGLGPEGVTPPAAATPTAPAPPVPSAPGTPAAQPAPPAAATPPAQPPQHAPAAASGAPARSPDPSSAKQAEPQENAAARPRKRRRTEPPRAQAAASQSATIVDFEFRPATVTVNVGDTVTWTNQGPTAHSATARDGSFDTDILQDGESASHTFNEAGAFAYICTPHPFMRGTVRVVDASAGGDQGAGSSEESGSSGESGSGSGGGSDPSGESAAGGVTPSGGTPRSDGAELPATGTEGGDALALGLALIAVGLGVRSRLVAG